MLRASLIFLCVTHGVHGQEAIADVVERDQFGCAMQERPDELTVSMFRDAWRSVAVDKLYSLRRHEAVVTAQQCDCAILRPDWTTIIDEFEALGFGSAPQSSYRDWSQISYFPVIAELRREVGDLCKEAS